MPPRTYYMEPSLENSQHVTHRIKQLLQPFRKKIRSLAPLFTAIRQIKY